MSSEVEPKLRGAAAASSNNTGSVGAAEVRKSLLPIARSVLPHLGTVHTTLAKAAPMVELAAEVVSQGYDIVSSHMDTDWLLIAYGLILCLFGGHYIALIATIEAFGVSGYEVARENGRICWEQARRALAASAEDDKVDADNNGVADVKQMSKDQLVVRKIRVVMLAVDPIRVTNALGCIYVALVATLATLQIQFAKVVTLGLSIASTLQPLADKTITPIFQSLAPSDYKRWVAMGVNMAIKSIACSCAWVLQTILSALQSASRGGLIVARAGLRLTNKHGYTNINHEATLLDEVAGWTLAALGVFVQLGFGVAIPFPLSMLLWPADVVEYFLRWMVVNQ